MNSEKSPRLTALGAGLMLDLLIAEQAEDEVFEPSPEREFINRRDKVARYAFEVATSGSWSLGDYSGTQFVKIDAGRTIAIRETSSERLLPLGVRALLFNFKDKDEKEETLVKIEGKSPMQLGEDAEIESIYQLKLLEGLLEFIYNSDVK